MQKQTINKVRLGAFVLVATFSLVLGLYYIGKKKNAFRSSIRVSALFSHVNGLMEGNNVRFNGINVGTVSRIYAIADTLIRVEFSIDEASTRYIGKNAFASIGTDGLLGNKLVNISPSEGETAPLKEGDIIRTLQPLHADDALRTLSTTNDNLMMITESLKDMSQKLRNENSLWHLLADEAIAENVSQALVQFRLTGENTAVITGDLRRIMNDIKHGKGAVGALLTDTLTFNKMAQTIINIRSISDTAAVITGNFISFSNRLNSDKNLLSMLLTDTTLAQQFGQSITNIQSASGSLDENMTALKYSWPFRKYFRKKKNKHSIQ